MIEDLKARGLGPEARVEWMIAASNRWDTAATAAELALNGDIVRVR